MGMKIVPVNLALGASISIYSPYGTEDVDYPLSNLVNGRIHPEARITPRISDGFLNIRFDFGVGFDQITNFIILNPDFDLDDGTFDFRYNAIQDSFSTNAVVYIAEGGMEVSSLRGHIHGQATDSAIATMESANPRWWYLNIASFGANVRRFPEVWFFNNADSTLDNQIVLPSANEQRGGSFNEIKTSGGNLHSKKNYESREFPTLRWEYLTEAEIQPFYDLHATCWPNGTFILYYENDDPIFCYYRSKFLDKRNAGMGLFHVEITVEEVPEPIWEA